MLGGEQNVLDAPRLRYLQDEIALIGEALERRQPLLGVCLGAQLLVAAAGGEVVRVSAPEIGWYEVETLPEGAADPLFGALPSASAPTAGTPTASSCPRRRSCSPARRSRSDGFRLGESAWGVQSHPEVTREILLDWFASYRDDPDAVAMGFDPQVAEAELGGRLPSWEALGRRLFGALHGRGGRQGRLKRRLRAVEDALEDRHDLGVELRAGAAAQLGARLLERERPPVRAVGGHRLVGVGDGEDAGLDRDRVAGQAVRIAAAVDRARGGRAPSRSMSRRLACSRIRAPSSGWRLISAHSRGVERARLVQDRVGDRRACRCRAGRRRRGCARRARLEQPSARAICSA